MSGHEKRHRGAPLRASGKSPIVAPPRAAIQGRSKKMDSRDNEVPSSDSSPEAGTRLEAGHTADRNDKARKSEMRSREENIAQIKIVALERELVQMEDEFNKEFEHLRQKLTNESERADHWQEKNSILNQQFLKADSDLRILRSDVEARERRREEDERDVNTRISSLIIDRDSLRKSFRAVKSELHERSIEVSELRSQIRGLKEFVSTNTRTDDQVTDEVCGEMMQKLGNGLQNWIITYFRKAKIDVDNVDCDTSSKLCAYMPTYRDLAATAKLHLLQSLVSRMLVDDVFSAYYIGLPRDRAMQLGDTEKFLSTICKSMVDAEAHNVVYAYWKIGSAAGVNQWRATTLTALRKDDHVLKTETTVVMERLISSINALLDTILDIKSTESRDQALRTLISGSISLAQLLRLQKAKFKLDMPIVSSIASLIPFDSSRMEDIGGEDEDVLHGCGVRCVTFPGIVKEGDEQGEQPQLRNIIAKARVLCSSDG